MKILAFVSLLLLACSPVKKAAVQEAVDGAPVSRNSLYQADHIVQIEITASQWDELRKAEPKGGRCIFGFIGPQYDWFKFEEIKIDGVAMQNIGAKKKSWCNSESKTKASMNIKLDKFVKAQGAAAQKQWGTDALILNNSLQDKAYVRQCLSYQIFARAGIPAPQCNFAHVLINGEDYGIFVNLEPMKKSFILEKFGSPLGNLYEIGGESFESWALPRFAAGLEGWKDDSLADIKAVIEAIKNDKTEELESLSQLVNMDQFIRYWAMEVIMTHWDGMTLGTNNSYIYFDKDGKMNVLPWGTDQILNRDGVRETLQVYAKNNLAAKIYASKFYRAKLAATIKDYMTTLWSEPEIIAEIDAMATLIGPRILEQEKKGFTKDLDRLKASVKRRREQIASFIDNLPEPTPSVVETSGHYFPKCPNAPFVARGVSFAPKATEGDYGYVQRDDKEAATAGVPCKVDVKLSEDKLPDCKEACPLEVQTAKDWGICSKATGYSCLRTPN